MSKLTKPGFGGFVTIQLGIFAKPFGTNLEIVQLHFHILSSTNRLPIKKIGQSVPCNWGMVLPYRLYCDDQVWLKIWGALDKALVVALFRVHCRVGGLLWSVAGCDDILTWSTRPAHSATPYLYKNARTFYGVWTSNHAEH
jgi:hypothetical protein